MTSTLHKPRVREATIDDVRTIVEFNRLLALESENKTLDPAVLTLGVEQALAQPALCRYFVAELGTEVVGQTMITYEWSDWRNGVIWWIQSVYVAPRHRGGGVFRALHEHIRTLAHAMPNVRALRLYVEQENHAAIATYRRMGLAPTGHLLYEHDWSECVREAGS
ncbi:MAG: GNAT family N-acetyltransferase [Planctomycetia bacterium]|nr:GNAT family N-acetyltransferase [Planctomycetia bacterium]